MPDQDGIELRWILTVVGRWLWMIVGCALLAAVAAFFVTYAMSPNYEATATLLIQPAQDTRSNEYNVLVAGERLALTYSEMLKGRAVLDAVISQNNLDETANQLSKRVTAQPVRDTQLIRLTVKDDSPEQAAFLANTIAEAFIKHIQTLQRDRYAGSLSNIEGEMGTLSSQINEIQAKIQNLNKNKIDNDAEQTQLESLLAGYRSNYQQLQQDYQAAQLSVAALADKVSIAEAARPSSTSPATTAVVTLILDLPSVEGEAGYSTETYGKMLIARPVLEAAIAKLDLEMDVGLLSRRVRVVPVPGTQLIELEVVNSDVSQATKLADAIAEVFIDQMRALEEKPYTERMDSLRTQMDELQLRIGGAQVDIASLTSDKLKVEAEIAGMESQLTGLRSDFRTLQQDYSEMQLTVANAADAVAITEPATPPEKSTQHRGLYIALAAMVSGVLSLGVAFLMEYLNDVVRTPEDITQTVSLSTLGSISLMKEPENGLVAITQSRSPMAEGFRVLATNLNFACMDLPIHTILVTSPHASEGKSLAVANLAAALAQREQRVVVVDADLRKPRLHHLFGLDQGKGLTGALLEGHAEGQLRESGVERLWVLTSGGLPPNPSEVIASVRMRKLLDELAGCADLVLIDCPPVLPVADASILASIADGVLLVVRADHTSRKEMRDTVESLRKVGCRLLGVILNGVSSHNSYYYHQYYGEEKTEEPAGLRSSKKSEKISRRVFGENGSHGEKGQHVKQAPSHKIKPLASLAQLFRRRG